MQQELDILFQMHHQVCGSIVDAKETISSLEVNAAQLEADLTIRRSYLGSVRYIPFEILGHIFQIYVDDNREHLGARGWLQLVCTKWRDAVLAHPNLWTRIDVVGPFDTRTMDSYINHIALCVLRSGARKLNVSFAGDSNDSRSGIYLRTRILSYLISYASDRWKSFKYYQASGPYHPNYQFKLDDLAHVFAHAPNLECVVICQHHNLIELDLSGKSKRLGPLLHDLRSLRTLQISLISWPILVDGHPLPQITELLVDGCYWRGTGMLGSDEGRANQVWLSLFPSLRSLSIRLTASVLHPRAVEEDLPEENFYQAKSLTSLTLHGLVPSNALRGVQFPVLQEVVIQPNDEGIHLFQHNHGSYPLKVDSFASLRLECQPGTLFWRLQPQYEDFSLFRDDIIPNSFKMFENAETVSAPGCIWRSFAWIFDTWGAEFAIGAAKDCHEVYPISMEVVKAAMEANLVGKEENWMPSLYSEDEDDNYN
jgi:hypothetical protein